MAKIQETGSEIVAFINASSNVTVEELIEILKSDEYTIKINRNWKDKETGEVSTKIIIER